jgi:HD superfamily phosphohydrolase
VSAFGRNDDSGMTRTQRIRDPIHDLIVFDDVEELDQLAWRLLNAREFQRLRRIKQLGFSELVYPCATHTRFAHCIGVFHNARTLIAIVHRKLGSAFCTEKANVAVIAALLHDLGHGPFSHTFEGVQKSRGQKKKHEEWTKEIVEGPTEVNDVLRKHDSKLPSLVGELLTRKDPKDIYDSVVSSQFDADRLDYLPRDRYMAGVRGGVFDLSWLLDCLEVGKLALGLKNEQDFIEVDGLYLSHKGLQAAESYLLARYHLYAQVYLHKTTRAAEQMLAALLRRVAEVAAGGDVARLGLQAQHPLVRFFQHEKPGVDEYLALDDALVWAALEELEAASDELVRELAHRLRNRRLYKCFDAWPLAKAAGGNALPRFRFALAERFKQGLGTRILQDHAALSAYGIYDYDEQGAFQKVLIARHSRDTSPEDIAALSPIVKSIQREMIYRVYAPEDTVAEIEALWKEVGK